MGPASRTAGTLRAGSRAGQGDPETQDGRVEALDGRAAGSLKRPRGMRPMHGARSTDRSVRRFLSGSYGRQRPSLAAAAHVGARGAHRQPAIPE